MIFVVESCSLPYQDSKISEQGKMDSKVSYYSHIASYVYWILISSYIKYINSYHYDITYS